MTPKNILILLIALFACACEDSIPLEDTNKELLDNYGDVIVDTLFAVADTFLVEGKISTANSSKLLVGSYRGFETRSLIKFEDLPADSIIADSLRLYVSSVSNFGIQTDILKGTVYLVTQSWEESLNAEDQWDYAANIDFSAETSAPFELIAAADTFHLINLSPTLLDIWRDTTSGDKNFGLLIDFEVDETNYIKELASRENGSLSLVPKLIYSYQNSNNDSTISDTVLAFRDASIIDFTGSFEKENVFISSGYTSHGIFKFDFSKYLGQSISIASAEMIFNKDVEKSIINENKFQRFYVRNITTEYTQLPDFEIDSSFAENLSYNIIVSDNTEDQLNIESLIKVDAAQTFIQSIVNNEILHGAFYMQYIGEGIDISVYAIRKSDDNERTKRPHLILEYFVIPNPRI